MRILIALISVFVAANVVAAPSQRTDQILIQGNKAGTQTVATQADGSVRSEYSFNDRGRGDHIVATWKLDAAGIPIEYSGTGNDYMKAAVEEHFALKDGKASWKNRTEEGDRAHHRASVLRADQFAAGIFRRAGARAAEGAEPHAARCCRLAKRSIEAGGSARVAGGKTLKEYLVTRPRLHAGADLARRGRQYRRHRVGLVLGRRRTAPKRTFPR